MRILITPAGDVQKIAIERAKGQGIYVIAADGNPSAPGMKSADLAITGDICDPEFLVRTARNHNVDGILSLCCDANMLAVSQACSELGLAGISQEVAMVSRNKLEQRKRLDQAGLKVPRFASVLDASAAERRWKAWGEKAVVIKPVDGSGSRGVHYIERIDEIEMAFRNAEQASPSKQVIIEEYIEGVEYSVEGWVVKGEANIIATSRKVRSCPPYLLDLEVHFPSGLSKEDEIHLREAAKRAIEACGYQDCPVHIECIMSSDGPVIVELAARGAGFRVFTEILPMITGIDTIQCSLECALGKATSLVNGKYLLSASLIFISPKEGLLRGINGIKEAISMDSIYEVEIYKKVGDRLCSLRSGSDRLGHILAFDVDPEKCRNSATQALNMIKVDVARYHE